MDKDKDGMMGWLVNKSEVHQQAETKSTGVERSKGRYQRRELGKLRRTRGLHCGSHHSVASHVSWANGDKLLPCLHSPGAEEGGGEGEGL